MNKGNAPASISPSFRHCAARALLLGLALLASQLALAQAQGSPFMTGATSLQTNILAWLTPIAVILVMVLGRDGHGKPHVLGLVPGRDPRHLRSPSVRRRS